MAERNSSPTPTRFVQQHADTPCELSVIIVNWNARDLLRDCLNSLVPAAEQFPLEVIVVDNASGDGSAEMVRAEFPDAVLIANDDNRGFAAANNQGMQIARGRYWLLLNPDTIVLDDCLARSIACADAHANVAVMGCQVLENEVDIQQTCFRFATPWYVFLRMVGISSLFRRSPWLNAEELAGWQRDTERDVEVVSGMFMLVRPAAAQQVGLMDEDYFVYGEEMDWCYRFHRAGWRCLFAPVGRIIHREGGGQSTRLVNVRMFVQQQKSLLIYHRKNLGPLAFAAARVFLILGGVLRWLGWTGRRLAGGGERAANRAACNAAVLRFLLTRAGAETTSRSTAVPRPATEA